MGITGVSVAEHLYIYIYRVVGQPANHYCRDVKMKRSVNQLNHHPLDPGVLGDPTGRPDGINGEKGDPSPWYCRV